MRIVTTRRIPSSLKAIARELVPIGSGRLLAQLRPGVPSTPMRPSSLLFGPCLTLAACASPCDYTTVGEICGAREVTVPIVAEQGWPVVEGRIGETAVRLLIDTGAASMAMSASLLGATEQAWHRLDRLCIGELCIEQAWVWAEDNELVKAEPGARQVHGLIGMSLLRHALVELDRGETVRLDFRGEPCSGMSIPLSFDDSGRPFAQAAIDGLPLDPVLLDSGALYTVLSDQTVGKLEPYVRERATTAMACDVNGCNQQASLSQLRQVCLGEQCEADVEVKFPVWDAIGDSFFKRARYVFDARARQLVRCYPY